MRAHRCSRIEARRRRTQRPQTPISSKRSCCDWQGDSKTQLRAFEWGSGLSTLHYPEWLASRGVRVSWITAEHDRAWFMQALEPVLRARGATIVRSDDLADAVSALRAGRQALVAVVFDKGPDPHEQPSDWYLDRALDRDEYVALPCELGLRYHVALVDGRKRRRCLLEAAKVLEDGGVALLHDAQRPSTTRRSRRSGRVAGSETSSGSVPRSTRTSATSCPPTRCRRTGTSPCPPPRRT